MVELEPIKINPDTFLREDCVLPALPEIVINIQALISTADANVENISSLILKDPALAAQILKIVNSAYYGFRSEIADIKFAVAYIGLKEIFNIVLSISVVETLNVGDIKQLEAFWAHSIYSARCAKFLAKKFEPLLSPESVVLGAILHDIGKLVYFKFFPEQYTKIAELAETSGTLYSEIEKEFEIPTSAYFGQLLCKRWNLPSIIRDACEYHTLDDINTKQPGDYKKIICCANLLAVLATESLADEIKQAILEALLKIFNCNKDDWLILMGEIYDLKQTL